MTLLLCCVLLTSCQSVERFYDTKLTGDSPLDWWHQMQGGPIADDRPPPPGIDGPYPSLGQVPARPTPSDPATRRALFARLAAQRDQARREAVQNPIAAPAPAAPAGAPAVRAAAPAPAPAPDPGASTAVLEAASTPPPVAVAAPPAAPVAPPPAAFTAPPRRAAQAAPAEPVASGPVPALPTAAPPLPVLAGLPATTTAPAVPRALPSVPIAFPPGSASLPAAAVPLLKELASRRAGAVIQVVAHGDAASAAPLVQEAALPLALRRARSIADVLAANGVPASALRSDAQALGRGGSARLVN